MFLAITALWSASRVQFSLIRVTNYTLTDGKSTGEGYVKDRLRSIKTILVTLFTLSFSLVVLVYGPIILKLVFGRVLGNELANAAIITLRWPLAMALYFLMISYNYYVLPTERVPYRDIVPGSIFASVGFLVVTMVYNIYTKYTANYAILYGSFSEYRRAADVVLVHCLGYVPGNHAEQSLVGDTKESCHSDSGTCEKEKKTAEYFLKGKFMSKKALIIMNPCSGTKRANKYLTEIVEIFTVNDYFCTVMTTTKRGDGTIYAREYGKHFDLIACIGGDGTFNEVVSGVMQAGLRIPIGYIPAGSTNDFASSLHIPKNIVQAAKNIVHGEPVAFDVGSFNGRSFSYVASFGAFTKTSYNTPQNVKNALGHLAYILDGITSIASIRAEHMAIEADGVTYEDDYIFGAISNSTSIAGILTLKPELVDMSDGLFELILVKAPRDLIEVADLAHLVTTQNYESSMLTFVNAKEFRIHASRETSWTLDGEYQEGCEEILVENKHHAINLMIK